MSYDCNDAQRSRTPQKNGECCNDRRRRYTSLSPPSPDFGSKMQLERLQLHSSFELCFSFNRCSCPKGHRNKVQLKPGSSSILEQLWRGRFFLPEPLGEVLQQQKNRTRHNCSKMQTTLVLAKPVQVAFRPATPGEAKTQFKRRMQLQSFSLHFSTKSCIGM